MDVIRLLPDSVANQIAAGEVIQRPASVVKELMENAIDAGAERIQLIVKEAGKKLIQVIDDGKGMSEVDARMSFERHATSKISTADDLFSLRTKGFRGEALASIAAIAEVELKTRPSGRELGMRLVVRGSKLEIQEATAHPIGSSFSVKNLFYNVPARRKFLKSDTAETKHIIEEFQRVAFAHPDIAFTMHKDEKEVFNLPKSSFRQRISNIMGSSFDQRLVPISEHTDLITVEGFICKPEFARRTRGEQYMFLNDRFIKHGYLHHAILQAYDNLLVDKAHPSYFLKVQVDPARVDVNIHPTKTEVKFDEERAIYMIISSAVRQSLGKYNIAPSLDFEAESNFTVPPLEKNQAVRIPEITVDKSFNPFSSGGSNSSTSTAVFPKKERVRGDWKELYAVGRSLQEAEEAETAAPPEQNIFDSSQSEGMKLLHLFRGRYILTTLKSGLVLIDPIRAHERILYESFIQNIALNSGSSQQLLFPETVDLSPQAMEVVLENLDSMRSMGFDVEEFGKLSIKVCGTPAEGGDVDSSSFFTQWVEDFIAERGKEKNRHEVVARTMARRMRTSLHHSMSREEMQDLIDRLFATEQPYHNPSGRPIIVNITSDEIDKKFEKQR